MVKLPSRRGITPVFGYTAPHPSGRGTSTLRIKTLPSTHYGPVRHPGRPGLSLAGSRLGPRAPLPRVSRVASDLLCRHAIATTPVGPLVRVASRGVTPSSPVTSAFPVFAAGRLPHRAFRGLLGVHSRYGLPARGVAKATLCIEGSGGFVTSTAAPIATGWSDRDAGRDMHPLKIQAFPRRTLKYPLRVSGRFRSH